MRNEILSFFINGSNYHLVYLCCFALSSGYKLSTSSVLLVAGLKVYHIPAHQCKPNHVRAAIYSPLHSEIPWLYARTWSIQGRCPCHIPRQDWLELKRLSVTSGFVIHIFPHVGRPL